MYQQEVLINMRRSSILSLEATDKYAWVLQQYCTILFAFAICLLLVDATASGSVNNIPGKLTVVH